MAVFRCLACGSSEQEGGKWEGCLKCAKCGAAMGPRNEQCVLSDETLKTLVPHQRELEKFGVQFRGDSLGKRWEEQLEGIAAAIYILQEIRPGTVQELVGFLKDLHIPYEEILRLRLDEPEAVRRIFDERRRY